MRFAFEEEQYLMRDTVRDMLKVECAPDKLHGAWENNDGRIPGLWQKFAELGILGMLVSEEHGGLAMNELDLVLVLEELGRAASPEPFLDTAVVGATLLEACEESDTKTRFLSGVVSGESTLSTRLGTNLYAEQAASAALILTENAGQLDLVAPEDAQITSQVSVDGSRKIGSLSYDKANTTNVAEGALSKAWNRGVLCAAAQMLGLAGQMIELAVEYAKVREQFGKPIGTFQAVKHHMVDALLKLEFAKPVVYRAAWSMVHNPDQADTHVSMAKLYASEAADIAAKKSLQVHGAIGYSYEYDLHMWMKRAWALRRTWGTDAWHRERVAKAVLDT